MLLMYVIEIRCGILSIENKVCSIYGLFTKTLKIPLENSYGEKLLQCILIMLNYKNTEIDTHMYITS